MYSEPITNVSIVIPIYGEANNLCILLQEIHRQLDKTNQQCEIILVDDGSPDNTWAILQEASHKYPMLRAVRLSRNFGKESALCAGLEIAKGKAVIVMDGDLQHPPHLIPQMISMWHESNIEIVEAVKVSRGKESAMGKLSAALFYTILNNLSGHNLKGASDFKLLDRKVVDAWLKMEERSLFFRGMTAWLGFRRVQIPFEVPKRVGGKSKWSIFKLIKLAITGITAFSSLPLHFVSFSGGFFIFAILLALQTLFIKLTGNAVSGFTTVIILLLMIGSLLMISLGIIGLYLARIYEEVKKTSSVHYFRNIR